MRAQLSLAVSLLATACGDVVSSAPHQEVEPDASVTTIDAPGNNPQFMSCARLSHVCGSSANDDCCASISIPGGSFYRSYDKGTDAKFPDTSYPATVSTFALDRYEVTVARFRQFVNAGLGTRSTAPAAGAGAHANLSGSGWVSSWDAQLPANTTELVAGLNCHQYQTWTNTPGSNDTSPINCVSWYEAMAFCIWDGGFLPTEAEWNYAAAGGEQQRAYPWSVPPSSVAIDCTFSNYLLDRATNTYCAAGPTHVGSDSPTGDGRWGHADMGGNVYEWTLDSYESPYPAGSCVDCSNLTATDDRVFRGGAFIDDPITVRTSLRNHSSAGRQDPGLGFRCARPTQAM